MLDPEGARNLFDQIQKIWIEPEIMRRQQTGTLMKGFRIRHCLIRLPTDKPPIVEFNDEIHWIASVKKSPGTSFEKGQQVFIHEVEEIRTVQRPEVNGKPVAFVFLHWEGNSCNIFFDFSPNVLHQVGWYLGEEIAKCLHSVLVDKTLLVYADLQSQLQKIGLWAAPALLPYPLSKIAKQLKEGDIEGARAILLERCTSDYLEGLSKKWWSLKHFSTRKTLIQNALVAHKEGKYDLSIHALLPQIEGIITDWVYTKMPENEIPWRMGSKTKKFRDLVLEQTTVFSYEKIVNSAIDFILGGPVLKTFKRWVEQIDQAFPNRNVVEHGKYDDSLFTADNSTKLFLLLDTLSYIISWHSKK